MAVGISLRHREPLYSPLRCLNVVLGISPVVVGECLTRLTGILVAMSFRLALDCGCAYNLACPTGKGRLAQWLERLVHTEEVGGSTPPSPTMLFGNVRVQPSIYKISLAPAPRWRNGRRAAFRAQCPYGCVGSNPSLGTKKLTALSRLP